SPAPASLASGLLGPSCSKTPWSGRSKNSLPPIVAAGLVPIVEPEVDIHSPFFRSSTGSRPDNRYKAEDADDRLRRNHGIVASFSRALVEGLSANQTDAAFNAMLDASIQRIYEASST